jgi:hypothetical protein
MRTSEFDKTTPSRPSSIKEHVVMRRFFCLLIVVASSLPSTPKRLQLPQTDPLYSMQLQQAIKTASDPFCQCNLGANAPGNFCNACANFVEQQAPRYIREICVDRSLKDLINCHKCIAQYTALINSEKNIVFCEPWMIVRLSILKIAAYRRVTYCIAPPRRSVAYKCQLIEAVSLGS